MSDKNTIKHQVYLALGSNLGNKLDNIKEAIDKIQQGIGSVTAVSKMYTTQPVGFESKNEFINAACKVESALDPLEILKLTQNIEYEMGRKSKSENQQYSDRIIDIDILFYDNKAHLSLDLTLPHPQLHERMFVLAPLADIARSMVHPVLNLTINQLIEKLESK